MRGKDAKPGQEGVIRIAYCTSSLISFLTDLSINFIGGNKYRQSGQVRLNASIARD